MREVVKVIVRNDRGEMLLLRRSEYDTHAGYWETPGGGVNEKEYLCDAALREVEEESGLKVSGVTPIYVDRFQLSDDNTCEKFLVHFYNLNINSDSCTVDLSDNPDHDAHIWFKGYELLNYKVDTWTLKQLLCNVMLEV